jgi:hypothetical protein
MRCDAQSGCGWPINAALACDQKYDQAAQVLCALDPPQREARWITQVAVLVRVSRERGEGESNPKGSVAVFWLLLACVAVKHPSTTLDRSSHHPAGFTTQSAQSKALPIRIRAWEAGGEPRDTTHLSLIGAESGVAATLQNCGESRTISPMHCNIPTSRSFSAPRIPFLIFYPSGGIDCSPLFWARIH